MIDLTGKNIATLKNGSFEYVILADIGTDDYISDAFTESGASTQAPEIHTPTVAPDGSVWRKDTNNILVLDQTNDNIHSDSGAGAKQDEGIVINGRSPNGRITMKCTPYVSGADYACVGPRFRFTGANGTGLAVTLVDNTVLLVKESPSGTFATLTSAAWAITTVLPVHVTVDFQGTAIKIALNGQQVISTTSTFNQYKTWVGLYLNWTGAPSVANTATAAADDFRFDPVVYISDRTYSLTGKLQDYFTESSDTNLESHVPDRYPNAAVWTIDVAGEQLYVQASNDRLTSSDVGVLDDGYVIELGESDGYVSAVQTPYHSAADTFEIMPRFRYDAANGVGWIFGVEADTDKAVLYKENPAGTVTLIDSTAMTINSGTGYTVRAEFFGSAIRIYVDNVLKITEVDTFNQTQTKVGVYAMGNVVSTSGYLDTFEAGPIEPDIAYRSLIAQGGLSSIEMSGPEGGGLGEISGVSLKMANQGLFSHEAEASEFLRGRSIIVYILGIDDTETDADRLARFSGHINRVGEFSLESISIECETSIERDIVPFPHDIISLDVYSNASLEHMGKSLPVPFGTMSGPSYMDQDTRRDQTLAFCPALLTDIFLRRYCVHGHNNDFPGSLPGLIWFDGEQNQVVSRQGSLTYYPVSVDSFGNQGFQVDWNVRKVEINPIRFATGNTFGADWKKTTDGVDSTYIVLDDGTDKLVVGFPSLPQRGTVSSVNIFVKANVTNANSISYNVKKSGSSVQTGTTGTSPGSDWTDIISITTISNWEEWNFGQMTLELTRSVGTINLIDIFVEVIFYSVEQLRQSEFPCFVEVTGYQDTASRYKDGSTITGAATLLRDPAQILQAILRDRPMGFNLPVARIRTTLFSTVATAMTHVLDFAISEYQQTVQAARSWIDTFCRRLHMAVWLDGDNNWAADYFATTDACVGVFTSDYNIAVQNPDAAPDDHIESLKIGKPGPIYNEFLLYYGWSDPLQEFTKTKQATGRFIASGCNGSTNGAPGTTFTATGQTFTTKNVLAGHKLYVRSGSGATVGIYSISSITSETVLVLSTSPGNSLTGIEYYAGPALDTNCVESFMKYGEINAYPEDLSQIREIQDDTTAGLVLADKIAYFAYEKLPVTFDTFLYALHLEYRDFIYIDSPLLPTDRAKTDTGGTLNGAHNSSTTSIAITGTLPTVGWFILIDNEVMEVTGNGASPITVTRGSAGSVAAAHSTGATIYRLATKWEILKRSENHFHDAPITLYCREV